MAVDAADNLHRYRGGEPVGSTFEQLAAVRSRTKGWIREGGLLHDLPEES
jgi:hypothetical protein